MHFLETNAPIRLPVRRLVWAFVVRMYQKRISRDNVHPIFKNSKLNVKVYTPYAPGVYAKGCIVFVFPFVCLSFPMFVRWLVRSLVIPLINCSLSLSPSLSSLSLSLSLSLSQQDTDPERFDSDNAVFLFVLKSNAVLVDEGRDDPNTTKAGHHRSTSETPFDGPAF